jgi:aspartyl-tRNA synthetase
VVTKLEVLNKTDNPPFLPDDTGSGGKLAQRGAAADAPLHRPAPPAMQQILGDAPQVYQTTRRYFDENGFLEIETPRSSTRARPRARASSSCPAARAGQLVRAAAEPPALQADPDGRGCDRYMQICRCFRDEDPRADRQAEFTQIDLEMSFVRREHVMEMMEGFVRRCGRRSRLDVPPIQRMGYREAMERFGIDRPDTRYGLEIKDISEIAAKTEVGSSRMRSPRAPTARAFNSKRGVVKAIRVPGGAEKLTRKITDGYTSSSRRLRRGRRARSSRSTRAGAFETGIAKFLEPVKAELQERRWVSSPATPCSSSPTPTAVATKALGELRQKVARDMGLVPKPGAEGGPWNFLWVVDFPMFEKNKDTGKWVAMHHPFTARATTRPQAFVNADVEATR